MELVRRLERTADKIREVGKRRTERRGDQVEGEDNIAGEVNVLMSG